MTGDSGMIEQALARDDRESAALLMRRHMERPLRGHQTWPDRIGGFRHGWENAPGRDQPPQHGTGALGLASPRPRPARPGDIPRTTTGINTQPGAIAAPCVQHRHAVRDSPDGT
jgi:hypothetical protein